MAPGLATTSPPWRSIPDAFEDDRYIDPPEPRYSGDKWLNENLSALRRYLVRNVGRPWSKVYGEISAVLDEPEVRDTLSKIGAEPTPKGPAEFEAMLKADFVANQKVVNKLGLKVE